MNVNLWIGLLLSIAGLVALVFALVEGYSTKQFIRNAQRTEGTVVELYAGPAHPKIEYVDESGVRHTFPGTGWTNHQLAEQVRVLFIDHGGQHAARLDEWGSLWFSVCMTAATGMAVLLAGVYLIWRR